MTSIKKLINNLFVAVSSPYLVDFFSLIALLQRDEEVSINGFFYCHE